MERRIKMKKYSHSKLSVFETCPYRYKLQYIDRIKVKEVKGVESFVGTLVHETLERLYKLVRSCKILTLEETLDDYSDRWRKQWQDDIQIQDPDLTPDNYKEIGRNCILQFYKRHHPFEQGIVMGLEKRISFPLDDKHHITGYIDRFMRVQDDVFEIHDYKTGKHLPTQAEVDSDRQLGLYDVAVRQVFPNAKEVKLVWHYLQSDTRLQSVRTDAEREALRHDTLRLIQQIESTEDFHTHESKLCDWCSYVAICTAKGHRVKVESLPPNRFLEEPGVKLVNRLAELSEKKKKLSAEIRSEMEELEQALIAYADQHQVEVIVGSDKEATIWRKTSYKFPPKNDGRREELEQLIKKAGKWEEVSDLSMHDLEEKVEEEQWPEELVKTIKGFQKEEKQVFVKLRKRKNVDEEG
jgi:putative RecB family exonuclease